MFLLSALFVLRLNIHPKAEHSIYSHIILHKFLLVFYVYFHREQLDFFNCSSRVAQKNLVAVYVVVTRHISTKLFSPGAEYQNKKKRKITLKLLEQPESDIKYANSSPYVPDGTGPGEVHAQEGGPLAAPGQQGL